MGGICWGGASDSNFSGVQLSSLLVKPFLSSQICEWSPNVKLVLVFLAAVEIWRQLEVVFGILSLFGFGAPDCGALVGNFSLLARGLLTLVLLLILGCS